ncbi:MAG: AbrB/MazE/SpoVT family DNA-binding domain-containing protein [archaeon]
MVESFKAQVIAGGRVTVPSAVRNLMGICEGDFVEVLVLRKVPVQMATEAA